MKRQALLRGCALRTGQQVQVAPYSDMSIADMQVLKTVAERFVSVLPKDQPTTIREWAVLILEEARSRRSYRRWRTYSERSAAEKAAGDLLSVYLKYGVPA